MTMGMKKPMLEWLMLQEEKELTLRNLPQLIKLLQSAQPFSTTALYPRWDIEPMTCFNYVNKTLRIADVKAGAIPWECFKNRFGLDFILVDSLQHHHYLQFIFMRGGDSWRLLYLKYHPWKSPENGI